MNERHARRIVGTLSLFALLLAAAGCDVGGIPSYMSADGPGSKEGRTPPPPTSALHRMALHGPIAGPAGAEADGHRGPRPLVTGVSPDEEIWVIARPPADGAEAPSGAEPFPGCGALLCRPPAAPEDVEVAVPLEHTDVRGAIDGYIASVTVRQRFHNPYDGKIEAVYVFPLPQNAAVSEFVMAIGERRIRGIIREREEARAIYEAARAQGYAASLLSQERPNVFTQRVANIEPGKRIDVELTYFNTLTYADGWYEFVFPMVVGPRFNPPDSPDPIVAAPREEEGSGAGRTTVPYLASHERSGHDVALELEIDAGVPVEEIASLNHAVDMGTINSSRATVTLARHDTLPNKDFVLRYRVAGAAPKASLLRHHDERGGFFTLMIYPPREIEHRRRAPIEMVFVVDCSGSMEGEPLAKARRAVERALQRLEPEDAFQIIRFSDEASTLGPRPLPATGGNVRRGLRYVRSLTATGGTMALTGIRAALDFPADPERVRFVTFLTDGFIGNEAEILGEVHGRLGEARIFSFGVGSSPNRYLMDRLARMGRGAVAYVGLNDDPTAVMDLFVERIRHPALTNIEIDFGELNVSDVHPARPPDLFVGRPVILTGRLSGTGEARVVVRGRVGEERLEIPVTVHAEDASGSRPALPAVWARQRIADLADRATWDHDPEIPHRIRAVALEYGLLSAYTSFVAVDSSRRTEGDHGTTVEVPVPVPDGVRYDTTVGRLD